MSGRKIKIIHDGSLSVVKGSKVVDAETGETLQWVRRVEVILDARGDVEAVLYVAAPEIEIDATVSEERAEEMVVAERVANEVEKRVTRLIEGLLTENRTHL